MSVTLSTLSMCQHDDQLFRFNVKDQDGVPVDISGATEITFIVAAAVDGAIFITKTLTGSTISIGSDTMFTLSVTDTESGGLTPGNHYWEAQITNSSGEKSTVGAGTFTVQDTKIGD